MSVYVIVKCAMSIDGYIDDASSTRLLLSHCDDVDRVDEVRADCDAILVGAATIRADNPRLIVASEERRQRRRAQGKPSDPIKVTLTNSGNLATDANFFVTGEGEKIVYCPHEAEAKLRRILPDKAEVVVAGKHAVEPLLVLSDLERRGVHKLLIEGGSKIMTLFLTSGLVDELQVSIAPFLLGNGMRRDLWNQEDSRITRTIACCSSAWRWLEIWQCCHIFWSEGRVRKEDIPRK